MLLGSERLTAEVQKRRQTEVKRQQRALVTHILCTCLLHTKIDTKKNIIYYILKKKNKGKKNTRP